nr:MAG TPA: hypothetical protein [Caudoviricetes sp.]
MFFSHCKDTNFILIYKHFQENFREIFKELFLIISCKICASRF